MKKYRAEFINKELRSLEPMDETTHVNNNFQEKDTGETLWAVIEAADGDEAKEKAERLGVELRTGQTKRDIEQE